MNIKRKIDLIHVRNWFRIGRNLSWELSFLSLETLLYFSKLFQTEKRFEKVQKKHKFILDYLDKFLSPLVKDIRFKKEAITKVNDKNIWMFWYSEEKKMPPIVSLCISSIRKHANGASVHLLTMESIKDYIEIPDYISEKYRNGKMALAVLTDYLRVSLISQYGGLWLDATIFVSQDIPESIFETPFYTLHTPYEKSIFVSKNKIHCYVLAGSRNSEIFNYIKNAFETYWQNHDFMLDYYLLDYIIMYGYYNNADIKALIDQLKYTPTSLYDIIHNINKTYTAIDLIKIENDNIFSKLNWRITPKETILGEKTVYGHLLAEVNNEEN